MVVVWVLGLNCIGSFFNQSFVLHFIGNLTCPQNLILVCFVFLVTESNKIWRIWNLLGLEWAGIAILHLFHVITFCRKRWEMLTLKCSRLG
jgi:hypothetical protein